MSESSDARAKIYKDVSKGTKKAITTMERKGTPAPKGKHVVESPALVQPQSQARDPERNGGPWPVTPGQR
jgi:hypothetical protein